MTSITHRNCIKLFIYVAAIRQLVAATFHHKIKIITSIRQIVTSDSKMQVNGLLKKYVFSNKASLIKLMSQHEK